MQKNTIRLWSIGNSRPQCILTVVLCYLEYIEIGMHHKGHYKIKTIEYSSNRCIGAHIVHLQWTNQIIRFQCYLR